MSKYPAIPEPGEDVASLRASVSALRQAVELLVGVRGDGRLRAATAAEMEKATAPYRLPLFFQSDLPAAPGYPRVMVYLVDAAGGKHLIFSDGATWRYPDGAAV